MALMHFYGIYRVRPIRRGQTIPFPLWISLATLRGMLKVFPGIAGEPPVLQRIQGRQLIGQHNQPKDALKTALGTFVPQSSLRQESAGPSTQ